MRAFVDMTDTDYHAHKAVGSTTLKHCLDSMAKFKAAVDGRIFKTDTDYFDIGKAAHAAVLEQNFDRYVCGPEVNKSTKAWKEFEEANPNKICLKESQYIQIQGMYEAFYSHTLAPRITNKGMPEKSFFVDILGQEYKARPDYIVPEGDERESKSYYLVDYKTTGQLDYELCQKQIANYGYDISAAHYIQVIGAATAMPITEYYWIFQEKVAPYEIAVFRMDDECKDRATKVVKRLYEKIHTGNKSGLWPSKFGPEIYDVDLPHYLLKLREQVWAICQPWAGRSFRPQR